MKFSFCGNLDAPDWILPHVSALSSLVLLHTLDTGAKINLLASHLIGYILEGGFEYDKLLELTVDSNFGGADVKACIAALHFVLTSAAKFDVDPATLSRELQQLGLPREHSDALCKAYGEGREPLQAKFLHRTLQCTPLQLSPLDQQQVTDHKVAKPVYIKVSIEKFRLLIHELKVARSLMEVTV